MLASDFDRTFYVNCEITEANIRAVENWRQQGNLFVIATGREESILREKLEEMIKPENYTGLSAFLARRMAKEAKERAKKTKENQKNGIIQP